MSLCGFVGGCAATTRGAQSEAQLNAGFARIQAYEAEIAAAQRRIAATAGECAAVCEAADAACAASAGLCDTAAELAEADALTRCSHAQDACDGDRAQAASCGCAAGAK